MAPQWEIRSSVAADGTDDSAALQADITKAAATNAELLLPSGLIFCKSPLSAVLKGGLRIRGQGRRLTTIQFAGDGLSVDGSQGNVLQNSFDMSDLMLLGSGGGTMLDISFGAGPIAGVGSDSITSLCKLADLCIENCANAIRLTNVWNGFFSNLFLEGTGPTAGAAITLAGCVANHFTDITASFFGKGFFFTQSAPGYSCQGTTIKGYITQAVPVCLNNDTPAGTTPVPFEDLKVSDFSFDNGNTPNANNCGISLHNLSELQLIGGNILQKGGIAQCWLFNVSNGTIQSVIFMRQDHSDQNTAIAASIVLDGDPTIGSVNNQIGGCTFGQAPAAILNRNTKGNRVRGNVYGAGGIVDVGTGNDTEKAK